MQVLAKAHENKYTFVDIDHVHHIFNIYCSQETLLCFKHCKSINNRLCILFRPQCGLNIPQIYGKNELIARGTLRVSLQMYTQMKTIYLTQLMQNCFKIEHNFSLIFGFGF